MLRVASISLAIGCSILLLLVFSPTPTHAVGGFFDNFLLFPRVRCLLAFLSVKFDIKDFDQYDRYFRDDSFMHLAQTGIYQGANNIEEYVKFAYAEYSPYLLIDSVDPPPSNSFLRYQDGQCEFLSLHKRKGFLDANNTNAIPPFDYIVMIKLFLDFKSRYLSRIHVYYTDDFLRVYFNVALNSDLTRKYVCEQVMTGPCLSQLGITNVTECESTLKALPTAEGDNNYIDGNSQGCRNLHAAFAATNPTGHCAHLSFTPLADPDGKIKCQTSLATPPSDLFTESDFIAYRQEAEKYGIDPVKGHNSAF
jgi:hypothetical protein